MPCCLFTWHTYGSWLPDRAQGHVHWSRGREPSSIALAQRYRQQQKESTAHLTDDLQCEAIEELEKAARLVRYRLHSVATDATHIHVLLSWQDSRQWTQLSKSIRRSLSIRLNQRHRRKWFSRGGNVKQIKSQAHFDHLIERYLPSHGGWKWSERRGAFR